MKLNLYCPDKKEEVKKKSKISDFPVVHKMFQNTFILQNPKACIYFPLSIYLLK